MIPQRFEQCNKVFQPPPDSKPGEVEPLHVYSGPQILPTGRKVACIVSAWKPTPEELVKLNLGESIYISFLQSSLPPHLLLVGSPWELPAKEAANDD